MRTNPAMMIGLLTGLAFVGLTPNAAAEGEADALTDCIGNVYADCTSGVCVANVGVPLVDDYDCAGGLCAVNVLGGCDNAGCIQSDLAGATVCLGGVCAANVLTSCGNAVCVGNVAVNCGGGICAANALGSCGSGLCAANVGSTCDDSICVANVLTDCGDQLDLVEELLAALGGTSDDGTPA